MNTWIDLSAVGKILLFGLIFGALLPTVFGIGLKLLTVGHGNRTVNTWAGPQEISSNPAAVAAAALCFLVVLAAIGAGIYLIVAGG